MRRVQVDDALAAIPSNALIEACQDARNADNANDQFFPASLLAAAPTVAFLEAADLNTLAKLNAVVADETVLAESGINTLAKLNALVADATVLSTADLDTLAELNALLGDATLYNQALRLDKGAGLTDGSGTLVRSSIITEGEFIKTTLFVDLTDLKSSTTDLDVIGVEGADLVTNGAFAADTDWTKGADWSIAAGVATAAPGAGTVLEPEVALTIEAGATYEVTFTMSGYTAGALVGSIGGTNLTSRGSDATFTERVVASDTTNLKFTSDATSDYDIDDVIVKKISGAFIGPFNASEVGALFLGTVTNLETPAGGVTDIDFYAADEATGLFDTAVTDLTETVVRTNGGAWSADINTKIALTALPADGQYLYFACGAAGTVGTYTAGQYMFEFWGA